MLQAHCRRLATGHLPAAAVQKVAADEDGCEGVSPKQQPQHNGDCAPASPAANGAGAMAAAAAAVERAVNGTSDRSCRPQLQPIRRDFSTCLGSTCMPATPGLWPNTLRLKLSLSSLLERQVAQRHFAWEVMLTCQSSVGCAGWSRSSRLAAMCGRSSSCRVPSSSISRRHHGSTLRRSSSSGSTRARCSSRCT